MSEQRIIELEIKTAYQEDLTQDLSQIISEQQQRLDRLEATCKVLLERIVHLQASIPEPEVDQTPPHY